MPALPVVFTHLAALQVEAAATSWSANRAAAPDAIHDDLIGVVALIGEGSTSSMKGRDRC